MVLGFQNYSSLPRHLRGMLGLSPELDPATHSARTQVCDTCGISMHASERITMMLHCCQDAYASMSYTESAVQRLHMLKHCMTT